MDGNLFGNITGVLFFAAFQMCGLLLSTALLKKESAPMKLLVGSVLGSVLLQWTPLLFAFFLEFSVFAHLCAVTLTATVSIGLFLGSRGSLKSLRLRRPSGGWLWLLVPAAAYILFCTLAVHSFRLEDGVVYSSQCTYGDMSMHLGFVTSIAKQGTFPPEYSILTGVPLAYPFLSDSISSSIYIFGASLRLSYLLPMFFAAAQVFCGFLLFMRLWLKKLSCVVVAFVLFFINGGFGFFYFLSGSGENPQNFTRIFTEFYETPTNLTDNNIRWVNVIVDMLIPQRATLFGWAVLFTAILLLYKGVTEQSRPCFVLTGVLAGALPMIHTHSFLVLALISVSWLAFTLFQNRFQNTKGRALLILLAAFPFLMTLLQYFLDGEREAPWLLPAALLLCVCFGLFVVILLAWNRQQMKEIARSWGIYLVIAAALALPQLLTWTLKQAQGATFTRSYFNWGNLSDNYLWFYLVNVGMVALLFVPAVLWAKRRHLMVISPVLLIWMLGELVVFQPNTYDNNKLLYIAYLLICGLVADYLVSLYRILKNQRGISVLAATVILFSTASAVLTMGRESVAEYELFGKDQMIAAHYIQEATEPADVILANPRHNNAVAAIAGRNLVCGSASYVYFHGLDYSGRFEDMQAMYENPLKAGALFEKYDVAYLMVSDYERGEYQVDEEEIKNLFPLAFDTGSIQLYKVKAEE